MGPAPITSTFFAFGHTAAIDGVGPDAKCFDQGELFEGQLVALVQLVGRHHDFLSHSTVDMDAQDLKGTAAVGSSGTAGAAVPPVEVGFNGTVISHRNAGNPVSQLQDLHAQFVAQHPGVGEVGLLASEGVQVGAADSDSLDTDQDVARPGSGWCFGLAQHEPAGLFESDRLVGHRRL
ncbi:MAG: hypothetical protein Ct9H300mP1_10210 [Planctomycetaceae bacterium]|nr:MAG: hypothetical protein Ct9H300mP1_10210 [Planctomycetaceae bacterium]